MCVTLQNVTLVKTLDKLHIREKSIVSKISSREFICSKIKDVELFESLEY